MNKDSSATSIPKRSGLWNFVNTFKNLKVGQKILSGNTLTLVILVLITVIVLLSLNTLTDDFTFLIEHDQAVLSNAASLEKLLVDIETGLRGFVITGKEEFLEPYNNGQLEFDKLIEEEKVLVSDNPPQVARLEEIQVLHEQWLALAAEPEIALRREVNKSTVTSDTLQETLRGGVGKGILDELRGVLDEMEANFNAAGNLPAVILTLEFAKDMVDQETGQRGFIITGEESFLEPYISGQTALVNHIADLRALIANDPTNSALLDQAEKLANDWTEQAAEPEIQARRDVDASTTFADVSAIVESGVGKGIIDETRAIFAEFVAIEVELNQQRAAEAAEENRNLIILSIGLTVLGAVIVLGSGFFIAGNITTSLNTLTGAAQTIIGGDLSTEVAVTSKDETGVLAGTFNTMTAQLRQAFAEVDRRAAELATVAEVGTATATILQTDTLLQEVVNLTKERFNLYHSHIFLLDEAGENLVLTSGAGEAGRIMAAEKRSIPLNREQSVVARAARERKGVTVNDVTQAPDFLANPLLPDTRSELAVPMIVGGKVIGVFDVQSDQVGRFGESDINIQTTLAAQISTSIQNVRSFEQAKTQADFETLVNAIGQKIQRAGTVEDTLQTAIRELGQALGAQRVSANIAARQNNDKVSNN